MTEKEKKPFFKKWWFWVIIAVVIIGGALSGQEDEENDKKQDDKIEVADNDANEAESKNNENDKDSEESDADEPENNIEQITIEAGMHEVGKDIEPGLYKSEGTVSYWARLSGFSGELDDIIANGNPMSDSHVVEIVEGDVAFESSGSGEWFLIDDNYNPEPATEFEDGIFIVGVDIEPGRYRSEGSELFGYWARLSGFSGQLDDVIANDTPDGSTIVEISESDIGFQSSGNGVWTKVE
ncbi:hypothetical protein [Amphibacillus sediminis]|uniref:hypothetical protein n=1 Tax=Amphibacillus sediminis TaxID=360185 RepID=UPI000836D7E2|nr:hypothetical protein [Amphibacillus sediminis]